MIHFSVGLPETIATKLDNICLGSDRIRQELFKELVLRYIEDSEDVRDATLVIERREPTTSLADLRGELTLPH